MLQLTGILINRDSTPKFDFTTATVGLTEWCPVSTGPIELPVEQSLSGPSLSPSRGKASLKASHDNKARNGPLRLRK